SPAPPTTPALPVSPPLSLHDALPILRFSTETIAAAIRQELARDGQAYVVHNRVDSIDSLAALVQRLVPEARVAVVHGQMPEKQRSEEHTSELQSRFDLVCRLLLEKKE